MFTDAELHSRWAPDSRNVSVNVPSCVRQESRGERKGELRGAQERGKG